MKRLWRSLKHLMRVTFWDWMSGSDLNESFEAARRFKD